MSIRFRSRAARSTRLPWLAVATAAALAASVLAAVPAQAAPGSAGGKASAAPDRPVRVSKVPVKKAAIPASATAVMRGAPASSWPAAGEVVADMTGAGTAPGGLPVRVLGAVPANLAARTRGDLDAADWQGVVPVRVKVQDQRAAAAAGVRGVLLTVGRADGAAAKADVGLAVGYAKFATAYGADYGHRLRVVALPECALTTPEVARCQTQTPVASANDPVKQTVTAERVAVSGASATVLALVASSTGTSAAADWTATDLSPTSSWTAGAPGGDFTLNYPIKVPAGLGGPEPQVSLGYSSGSVDGKTAAKTGQSSVVGEGWNLSVGGFVERSFRSCADDDGTGQDLCWVDGGAVTMMLNGRSTKLVSDANGWHAVGDEAMRIESIDEGNAALRNGARDGEYWKVTTQDGTQYYFGRHKRYVGDTATTNSVLTEPVVSNDGGDPCNSLAGQWCQEAYRWNLDYVVDPRQNTMTLFYTKFQGTVGFKDNTSVQPYDLSATLDRIEYGTRKGTEAAAPAPMKVTFTYAERCWNSCAWPASGYADTPADLYCDTAATSCANAKTPMHFTRKRLSAASTQVYSGSAYRNVDRWDLEQTFLTSGDYISPAGDDTAPNLWLNGLTHTGYAADGVTTAAEPQTTFGGTRMANRTDWGNSLGMAPYMHWRITQVGNGIGGQTTVTYADTDCVNGAPKVNSDSNPFRCFPQFYKGEASQPGFGWFNKYVVESVTETDLTGGSPDEVTSYAYSTDGSLDTSLWAHDDVDLTDVIITSWADWRGYPTVTTTHGSVAGQQTVTKDLYYRGLLGDAKKNGTDTAVLFDQRQSFTLEPLQQNAGVPIALAGGSNDQSLCVDIANWNTANGTPIQSYPCTGDWNQVWQRQTNGTNALKNPQSGKCLDVKNAGTANGSLLQLYQCTGGDNQAWLRQPDGSLKNVASGRCLEMNDYYTLPNGQLQIWDCVDAGGYFNQTWMPTTDGALQSVQGTRCASATDGGTANGTTIENYGCAWNDNQFNQIWQLEPNGTVKNPESGRCLTIDAAGTGNGTTTYLWDCTAAAKQIWTPLADGSLKNPSTGRCLDAGGNAVPHALLFIYDCNGNLSQQWVGRTPDHAALNGQLRAGYQLDNGTVSNSTVHTYTVTETASRAAYVTPDATVRAYLTRESQSAAGSRIAAGSTWRWTRTDTTYDGYGLPTAVKQWGDVTAAADDTCTTTTYARTVNATAYLVDYPAQSVVTDCSASPSGAGYLSGVQTQYDGGGVGAGPTQGLATQGNALTTVSGTALTWAKQTSRTYDPNGRPQDTFDALNNKTMTRYTPSSGGPVTAITVTNPKLHVEVTTLEPGHGVRTAVLDANNQTTNAQYDPLGRLTKVWLPGRATNLTPDTEYGYTLSNSSPNVVTTKNLGPSGNQITTTDLHDGRMRPRQSQKPAAQANGGRIIDDVRYDARGLTVQRTTFWDSTTAPGNALAGFANTAVRQQTRTAYDALGRPTVTGSYAADVLKWQTTTSYDGNSTTVVPPSGGTPTKKTFDVAGDMVELRQYTTGSLGGASQATTYTYDRSHRLTKVTDPAANVWTATYDRLGRRTATTDPDSGATSYGYDAGGRMTSSTDARLITLAYTYDELNRKTAVFNGATGGFKRADWTYDTVRKGSLSNSKRYAGGLTYTAAVDGYDAQGRPTSVTTTLPVSAALPSGSYTVGTTYNVDGSVASKTHPLIGGLPAETVNYTYDTTGRPIGVAGAETYVADTSYYGFGPAYQQILGSGTKKVRRTSTVDEATGRTTGSLTETQNQTVTTNWDERLNQTYAFDDAGNITGIKETSAATVVANECFRYDGLRQLTEAWTTTAAACQATPSQGIVAGADAYWTSYTYQLTTGNRTTETKHATAGNTVRTYSYPASGATSVRPHTISGVTITGAGTGTDSYAYGAIGNTTTRNIAGGPSQTLTWDNEGLVASVTAGTATTTYTYDADGNRLVAVDPTGTTVYLPGFELRKEGGNLTCTRYYGGVASRTPAGLTWLAADHHGTADLAVSAGALTTTRRRLDPFGNPRATAPAWPNVRGFVNGTTDGTGLTHLGARDYEPATGRFISDDPITDLNDPLQVNGYVYAAANPVTNSDPTGLRTCSGPEDCGTDASHGNPSWGSGSSPQNSATSKTICGGNCYKPAPRPSAPGKSVYEQECAGMSVRACEAYQEKKVLQQKQQQKTPMKTIDGTRGCNPVVCPGYPQVPDWFYERECQHYPSIACIHKWMYEHQQLAATGCIYRFCGSVIAQNGVITAGVGRTAIGGGGWGITDNFVSGTEIGPGMRSTFACAGDVAFGCGVQHHQSGDDNDSYGAGFGAGFGAYVGSTTSFVSYDVFNNELTWYNPFAKPVTHLRRLTGR